MRALFWIAAALSLLSGPALAEFQDCTTPEFAERFLGDDQFSCDVISQRSVEALGRTVQMRALRQKDDSRPLQYEPLVMNAAETTLAWLTPYAETHHLKINDISFVFPDTPTHDSEEVYGRAIGDTEAPDCVVLIYSASFDNSAAAPLGQTAQYHRARAVPLHAKCDMAQAKAGRQGKVMVVGRHGAIHRPLDL